jgi:hypothetical protein
VSERDDPPHQPPSPLGIRDSFNQGYQVAFVATSFIFVIFAALGVRIARRLRRDHERNKNIIDAEWTSADESEEPTDIRLR